MGLEKGEMRGRSGVGRETVLQRCDQHRAPWLAPLPRQCLGRKCKSGISQLHHGGGWGMIYWLDLRARELKDMKETVFGVSSLEIQP